jgi:hypothetical protein
VRILKRPLKRIFMVSPDFRFQLPNPFCQSRLADVQEPGSPAKMQLSSQGQK